MEIVYCGDCGKSLRHDEFAQGKAHYLDDVPYCTACRPLRSSPSATQAVLKRTTARIQRHTSGTHTARSRPPAESPPKSSRAPMIIGGALVGAALLVLLLVFLSGGTDDLPREVPSKPRPPPDSSARGAGADRLREEAASGEALRRREQEERRRRGEARMESLLARIREIRAADPGFARSAEVMDLFASALAASGPRRAEVERLRAEYEKASKERPDRALAGRRGPYDLDGDGFVNHWLIVGPFPNKGDKEFYTDYLNGEEQHEPGEGVEVQKPGGRARWAPYVANRGHVNFFAVPHLGLPDRQRDIIQYAACWLECDRDVEVEFRVRSDDGFRLWVDRAIQMTRHVHRAIDKEEDSCPVKLARGVHLVLLKVDQGDNDHGFVVKVVTPQGAKPPGVRVWN